MAEETERAVILRFLGILMGARREPEYDCGHWRVRMGGITPPLDFEEAEQLMADFPGAFEPYMDVEREPESKPEAEAKMEEPKTPIKQPFDTRLIDTYDDSEQIIVKVTRRKELPKKKNKSGRSKLLRKSLTELRALFKKTREMTGSDVTLPRKATKAWLADAILEMTDGD